MSTKYNYYLLEPKIHSHITNILPAIHDYAYQDIYCDSCNELLHASHNKCMQTWIESGIGHHCLKCMVLNMVLNHEILDSHFALTSARIRVDTDEEIENFKKTGRSLGYGTALES